jgi:hypothetical protein
MLDSFYSATFFKMQTTTVPSAAGAQYDRAMRNLQKLFAEKQTGRHFTNGRARVWLLRA